LSAESDIDFLEMRCWFLGIMINLSELASALFTRLFDPVEWRNHNITATESSV
jgi:hypothetical protein